MGPCFHDVVAIILGPSLWPWTHLKNITWIDLTQKFNVWGIDIRAWNILEDLMQVRFFSEQNTQTTIKKSHSTSSSGGCLFVIIVHYGPKYIRRITEVNRQLQLLRSSNNQTELRRRGGRNHKLSPKVKAIHSLGLFLLENLICQSCCDSFGRNQSIKEAHNILKITSKYFCRNWRSSFSLKWNSDVTEITDSIIILSFIIKVGGTTLLVPASVTKLTPSQMSHECYWIFSTWTNSE